METRNIVEEIQKNLSEGVVVEYNEIQAELAKLQDEFGSVVPDCSTKDGYEFSKNAAMTCRDIRTKLESIRKEKKEPYLNYGRLIDSQAKEIKESVEAIESPHKTAYQAVDQEKKRILEERKQIISDLNNIRAWAIEADELQIEAKIDEVSEMDMSKESFGRLLDDAISAQSVAMESLHECHAMAVNRRIETERIEAERLELEKLREEQRKREEQAAIEEAERSRIEREAEIARQAEERARAEAKFAAEELERQKAEAEAAAVAAENARIAAEEKAKQDAIEAAERARKEELARQEQEQAKIKAEAEARAADKKHRAAINNAVKGAFIAGGLSESEAELATKLLAAKKIPHTVIIY